jgi:leader peptidase (prepilin peptidase) / N-methyltransferase
VDPLVAVVLGVLGVLVGAFLNVVIDRVPDRAPLRGPCDGEASAPVQWGPVPAQPWLLRLGADRSTLPRRWLWVELVTVAVLAVVGGRAGSDLSVVPLAVLGAALVAVSVIDLQLLRIPDRVTFPTLALAVPLVLAVSLDQDGGDAFRAGLIGALAYFVALLVPHLVYPRGMGFGDVKLALLMGLYLGWRGWEPEHPVAGPIANVLYGLMLGCILGVVFGVGHQLVTRRRGEFPFGPALALGCLVVVLW